MAEPIVQDKDQGMTYLQLSQQSRSELRSKFEKYERPPGDSTLAGPRLQLTNMAGKYFKKYFHNFIFSTLSLSAFVFCAGWKIFFTSLRILKFLIEKLSLFNSAVAECYWDLNPRFVTGHVGWLGMNGPTGCKVWSVFKISTKTWQTLAKINCTWLCSCQLEIFARKIKVKAREIYLLQSFFN